MDLTTEYMGLKLRNPLMIASCSLSKSLEDVKKWEDAGAGAIVLKSLFEEQIKEDAGALYGKAEGDRHTEGYDYIMNLQMDFGTGEYLKVVEAARTAATIPVIASVNCRTDQGWTDFARKLQNAGASGLELNISVMPTDPAVGSDEVEERILSIVQAVAEKVDIPVAVKIGPYFSAPAKVVRDIVWRGARALVLFNRFYQFDIDVDAMKLQPGNSLSSPSEITTALRWIAVLSGRIKASLAATTGVHGAEDALKGILAGADVVQLCSTLYRNGPEVVMEILEGISEFLKNNGFDSLDAIKGTLSQRYSEQPESYERLQYIKALVGIE